MSQVDPTPPSLPIFPAAPQVVYLPAKSGRGTQLLLFVLIVAVLVLIGLQVLPHLKLPSSGESAVSREELLKQLEPEALVTPTGRRLDVVEFGGRLFEITRVVYDQSDSRRCLVSITVPGIPPQQNIFRPGDSFDRGRIIIKEVGDGYVVLKCDGEQRTFGVQGLMPDAAPAQPAQPMGATLMPPRDFSSAVPPAPQTGRVKAPEHPMAEQKPDAGGPVENDEATENEGTALEDLPEERHFKLAREEYRKFIDSLPAFFTTSMVLQTIRDPENMQPWGMQIKRIDSYGKLSTYGLRSGDVIVRISQQATLGHGDIDAAFKQPFRDSIEIEVVRGDSVILFVIEAGVESPAKPR